MIQQQLRRWRQQQQECAANLRFSQQWLTVFIGRQQVPRNVGTARRHITETVMLWHKKTSFAGGTLLTIPPVNQTTLAGETAHFTCVSKDKDAVVTWYKDGVPLSNIPDLNNRASTTNGSLLISPTDVTDPGEYSCAVKNSRGDRQTASAYLNVQCEYKCPTVSMHAWASLYSSCMAAGNRPYR
jgi:hypothetical protein